MSKRSAEVELKLKAGQYKAEAKEAKHDTESLNRSTEELDRSLKKLPPDAVKAAASLKLLGAESGASRVKLEDLGRRSTVIGDIEHRLASARAEAKKFADEFNRTGSVDAFSAWRKAAEDVKSLERLGKDLEGAVRTSVSKGASNGLAEGGVAGGPLMVGAIAGAITVGAPILAGAIAAAVGGGLAGGALAVAIVAASKDKSVAAAWGSLGTEVSGQLGEATRGFRTELITDADLARQAWDRILPGFARTLNGLEPTLHRLVVGGLGAAEKGASGLEKAIAGGGKVLDRLAAELPGFGKSVGDSLAVMVGNGEAAAEAIHDVIVVTEAAVRFFATLVNILARVNMHFSYIAQGRFGDVFRDISHAAQDTFGNGYEVRVKAVGDAVAGVGTKAALTADDMSKLSTQINHAAVTADSLAAQMAGKVFSTLMNLDQATLAFAESQTRLADVLRQNGKALDIHTAKGQANREAILAAVSANMAQYQAMVASGISATDAARQYDTNTQALYRQLRQAGMTQAQIDGLIGKYKGIPDVVNTAIAMNGLTQAINDLNNLIRLLNGLPPLTTINVKYSQPPPKGQPQNSLSKGKKSGSGNTPYAAGGLPDVGVPYTTGEHGMETRMDFAPGRILSHRDTMTALTNAARPPAGGGVMLVQLQAAPGDHAAEAVLTILRPVVQQRYAGSADRAMGGR